MAVAAFECVLDQIRRLADPIASGASDAELLTAYVERRDDAAFAALVERHGPLVFAVCRRAVGDTHLAEDCFQSTFLALARQAHGLHRQSSLAGWLFVVALRIAQKARHRARRHAELPAGPSRLSDPLEQLTAKELCEVLDEELARLPARHREPVLLCCVQGLTRDEAARRLGWSVNSLRGRLERGRAILRKRLQRRGLELPTAIAAALLIGSAGDALPPTTVQATMRAVKPSPVVPSRFGSPRRGVSAKTFAAGTALLAATITGVALWCVALQSVADGESHEAIVQESEPREQVPAPMAVANKDPQGDPLPDGAVARIGSLRLRHAGLGHFVFLADGKTVVSIGRDRFLRFWDIQSGRQVRSVKLQGENRTGWGGILSRDGKTIAASEAGRIVVWDVESGKQLRSLVGTMGNYPFLLLSPDSKTLAQGSWQSRVTLWDLQTGKERTIEMPKRKIGTDSTFHARFSPDSKRLVVGGGWDEPLLVYDMTTGNELHRFQCFANTSCFSPDGKRLAVACMKTDKDERRRCLRLFDMEDWHEIAQFEMETEYYYYSLTFSPDGKTIACGFSDDSCLLDSSTGRVLMRLTGRPMSLTFSADGRYLAGGTGQRIRLWDMAAKKEIHAQSGDLGPTLAAAVSPDGRLLATADWIDHAVDLWDTANGRHLRQMPLRRERQSVRNLTFSPDGQTLSAAEFQGFIHFWDVATGVEKQAAQLEEPGRPKDNYVYYFHLHVSDDRKHVSTLERRYDGPGPGSECTRLVYWDTATGKPLTLQTLPANARNCAWRSDGRLVALALKDGLTLIDVESGERLFRASGASDGPVAASPDFRLIAARRATGSGKNSDAMITVWESVTGNEVATVAAGQVKQFALTADNRFLVTCDAAYLRLFDLTTAKERRRWPLPIEMRDSWGGIYVTSLVLTPDGRRAITALADGTGLIWDLSSTMSVSPQTTKAVGEDTLLQCWNDLAGDDASRAYATIWKLTEGPPDGALAFFAQRLKPTIRVDAKEVAKLIVELNDDSFEVRENASKALEKLGSAIEPLLRQALEKNPSPETKRRLEALLARPATRVASTESRRRLRAMEVLERLGSKSAQDLLSELANGATDSVEAREARASLARLSRHGTTR
jgi:RNA polymerase sigma factor (sigma-70 family)